MEEVAKKFAARNVEDESAELKRTAVPQSAKATGDGLREHAAAIGITGIESKQFDLMEKYCLEVWQWNEKINLTRHTDAETFVKRDLLDTWQLIQHLQPGERVLDFGSGSGVPGLSAAILRPDLQVTLCDSVQKKARVLEAIVAHLKLPVTVMSLNVKQVLVENQYTTLTARAVGSLSKMCTWLEPFWPQFERLLTIKGPSWVDERGEARHLGQLRSIELRKLAEYPMPDRDLPSVILQLRREQSSNA